MNNQAKIYDVIIIGGGPTGLTAGIYTAREGYSTLVLESGVIGGMAALTAEIENYPGFAGGIGGLELSDNLLAQAKKFGVEVITGLGATKLERDGDVLNVHSGDIVYRGRSVIVATGSSYKKLGVPGEAELIGRGVHFCATCDGPIYKGRELIVVGGGNSALQETEFLARFASHITILVRGPEFGGSQILIDQVKALTNVSVQFNTSVAEFVAEDQKLKGVKLVVDGQPQSELFEVPGAFVLIGLLPNTTVFGDLLTLDERGFIKTDAHFATNLPGVFCAGDVRSGSTWQIASAVGEGAAAALSVREYLGRPQVAEAKTAA